MAGRNKPFKFSIDLSSILVTLSTEMYIEKKVTESGAVRRKSRIILGKSIDSGKSEQVAAESKLENAATNLASTTSADSLPSTDVQNTGTPTKTAPSSTTTSTQPNNQKSSSPESAYDPLFEGDNAEFQFLKLFVDEASQTVCVVARHKKARRLVVAFRGSMCEQNIQSFDDKTASEIDIVSMSPEVSFPPRMLVANSFKLAATSLRHNNYTDNYTPSVAGSEASPFLGPSATTTPAGAVDTGPAQHTIQVGSDLYTDTWKENTVNEEILLQIPLSSKGLNQTEINNKSIEMRMQKLASVTKEPSPSKLKQTSSVRLRRQSSLEYDDIEPPNDADADANVHVKNMNCVNRECKKSCLCVGHTTAHVMSTSAGIVAYCLATVERRVRNELHKYPRFAPKMKLHNGFWAMYNSIRNPLHEFIRTELVLEPTDVFVTGHCLGGALATICAFDLSVHTVAPINLYLNSNPSKTAHKRRRR